VAIAPVKIWHEENGAWKPVAHNPISISKPESFRLEYNVPCNPDAPFTVSIAGISTAGESNVPTTIDYQRAKLFHTGIRLPY
jgi:hypothetical protein